MPAVTSHDPRSPSGTSAGLVLAASLAVVALAVQWIDPESIRQIASKSSAHLLNVDIAAIRWYLTLLGAVCLTEVFCVGWQRSSAHAVLSGTRSTRTDLILAAVHIVGWGAMLTAAFSVGILWYWHLATRAWFSWSLLAQAPTWLQFAVALVIVDFLEYWHHRLAHRIQFLWEAHKYHHAATTFTILTGSRNHALDEGTRVLFTTLPPLMVGAPPGVFIGARVVLTVIDLLQHSSLPWTYGWVGRWLVYSPAGHRLHHSCRQEHWDRNFGNFLVIWDRLFGTWHPGSGTVPVIGLQDNPYNQRGIVTEYLMCLAKTARAFAVSIRTGQWRSL